jgi:outer membrane biosynthesis protein TonB
MARRMNLSGTVKVVAVVAQDGKVKKVEPVGGSPLLVQSAQDAIMRWKYAPGGAESRELIELRFHPE